MSRAPAGTDPPPGAPRRRILVVEDDAELREALADVLRRAGFDITTAADGRAALESMRRARPDLVVLDLMLPVMDGWEVLAVQRNDPNISDIPVVVVSGNTNAVAAAVHADLYIVKPIDATTIVHAVDDVLRSAEHRREPARLAHGDRLAALGTLAAGIAHEVTNPLTYMVLELEKIRATAIRIGDADVAAEFERAAAKALDGADRIKGIVHDVAAFARAEGPEMALVDMQEAARVAMRLVRHRIETRARLTCEERPTPLVRGSEGRLVQVVLNLLVNAAQAIPDESPAAHQVRVVSGTDEEGWAFLQVTDSGRGIPAHLTGRIFEPFFTTKPAPEGTGLGLALCHDIVSSLGGEIRVLSKEGHGATFLIRLPPATAANARD